MSDPVPPLIRCEALLAEQPDAALRAELARIQLARGARDEAHAAWSQAKALDPTLRDEALDQLAPQLVEVGAAGPQDLGGGRVVEQA